MPPMSPMFPDNRNTLLAGKRTPKKIYIYRQTSRACFEGTEPGGNETGGILNVFVRFRRYILLRSLSQLSPPH